ncbi:histidine kinase [Frankia sp. AiPs1]|uniref:sensor histidine kinase n=1 Tax=Frankia sp. AiPa1 TaxID=573492 RepID=UPI00202B18D6|nr:histidine kinase [Frankia sp. AiPa1]MCL9759373.1 histidine kinase [Frankia sp. AiPa1]
MHRVLRYRPAHLALVGGGATGTRGRVGDRGAPLAASAAAHGCDGGAAPTAHARAAGTARASVITLVGLAPLIGATVWAQVDAHPHSAWNTVDIAAAVVSWALLAPLIRAPLPAALGLAALAVLSPAATPPATLAVLHVAARRRLPLALAVAAAGIGAHAARAVLRPPEGMALRWWLVLIVVSHAALVGWGALARARAALVASLVERAERAEAEQARRVAEARAGERTRLAREMHDVLAHRLSLLATYAGALQYRPDAPPEALAQAAGVIRDNVAGALDELREVIAVLRDNPDHHDDHGGGRSPAAPLPTLADLPALLDRVRAAGTPITYRTTVTGMPAVAVAVAVGVGVGVGVAGAHDPGDTVGPGGGAESRDGLATLAPAVGRAAYRVVQEALTNAHRHAPGQPVHLTVRGAPGQGLTLDIVNSLPVAPAPPPSSTAPHRSTAPPTTAPPTTASSSSASHRSAASPSTSASAPPLSASPGGGMGLVGLTERVRLAGGQLDHQSAHGEFRLHADLPWPRA